MKKLSKNRSIFRILIMILVLGISSTIFLNVLSYGYACDNLTDDAAVNTLDNSVDISSDYSMDSSAIVDPIASTENTFANLPAETITTLPKTLYEQSEEFFNDSYVHKINLTFEDPNWYSTLKEAHANNAEDPYFPVKFQYDNITLDPVGINFKGYSSFHQSGIKKSFKIDFTEYDSGTTFFGMEKLNLNNGFSDPTMIREKLFLDFASNYVTTIRCTFTEVYINGEYWGLFIAVENIDQSFIDSRFGSHDNGNLYRIEQSGTLDYLGDQKSDYSGKYELKTNKQENDWSDLISFVDILNNAPKDEFKTQIENVLNINEVLYTMALNNLFSNLDSYLGSAHNFYLYYNEATGKFNYLIWDTNMSFGTFKMGLGDNESALYIDPFWLPTSNQNDQNPDQNKPPGGNPPGGNQPPGENPPDQVGGNMLDISNNRPLITNLLSIAEYNQTYLSMIAEMMGDGFNYESMNSTIEKWTNLIRDSVYSDPNYLYTKVQFEQSRFTSISSSDKNNAFGLEQFITERESFMSEFLKPYNITLQSPDVEENENLTVIVPDKLIINEVMAKNSWTISSSSDYPTYEDWIELYNGENYSIDLSGMYLTDNLADPTAWQIPEGTTIKSKDFLVIWMGGEESINNDGALHTNFGLSGNGELIALIASDSKTLINGMRFGSQITDISIGRYPDGNISSWLFMEPTANISNFDGLLDQQSEILPQEYAIVGTIVGIIIGFPIFITLRKQKLRKKQNGKYWIEEKPITMLSPLNSASGETASIDSAQKLIDASDKANGNQIFEDCFIENRR
ncbi:MAG: CotH kinase family protein [Promethearchaeota archaeon]